MSQMDLIATAAFGLEGTVAYELQKLGYDEQYTEGGRVVFRGDWQAVARTNLWLRAADRVLIRMGEFQARTFDELYDQIRELPWADFLPVDATFPMDGKSVSSILSSVPAVQRIAKKAVVDALAERYKRSELPETGPRYQLRVSILKDIATVTLDTTGEGLHKRGYRDLSVPAPLKETLAAGLILLARWHPDRPFADPFCGSGTLPIEAAMIGRNVAPGIFRRFDAEYWKVIDPRIFQAARKEALAAADWRRPLSITGGDISIEALSLSARHARWTEIGDCITWKHQSAKDLHVEGDYGMIITNPPYGIRLGEESELKEQSAELGLAFANHPTWSCFALTAFEDFERPFGKIATKKRKLYNGRIRCDYYQFMGPRRPSRVETINLVPGQE
jgi:putative N6-adenine-specific DNA methylase